jgi:hypothetical protein
MQAPDEHMRFRIVDEAPDRLVSPRQAIAVDDLRKQMM